MDLHVVAAANDMPQDLARCFPSKNRFANRG
jgi:hypothetical protein